jgi:hypothetical protein
VKATGTVLTILSVTATLFGISTAAPLVISMGVVGTVIAFQLMVRASHA